MPHTSSTSTSTPTFGSEHRLSRMSGPAKVGETGEVKDDKLSRILEPDKVREPGHQDDKFRIGIVTVSENLRKKSGRYVLVRDRCRPHVNAKIREFTNKSDSLVFQPQSSTDSFSRFFFWTK